MTLPIWEQKIPNGVSAVAGTFCRFAVAEPPKRTFLRDKGTIATGAVTDVPLGGVAVQAAVTPDGKYAFASLYDTKEVVRYDLSGELVRIGLPAGSLGPIQLYPTPDSNNFSFATRAV